MTDLVKVKTALISVSDKTDLLVLAAALKECGVQVSLPARARSLSGSTLTTGELVRSRRAGPRPRARPALRAAPGGAGQT